MSEQHDKAAAKAGLAFMQRAELKGAEVPQYIAAQQLLADVVSGRARVVVDDGGNDGSDSD